MTQKLTPSSLSPRGSGQPLAGCHGLDATSSTAPDVRRKFGTKERRAANDAQVLSFFRGYERQWRLSKLLLIRSLLSSRAGLRSELEAGLGPGFKCDDDFLYGPVTNGLIFSAVAEVAMLVEDLLALIKHIRSRDSFARSLVHYDAGSVTAVATRLKSMSDERLRSAFMVPSTEMIGHLSLEDMKTIANGTAVLFRRARDVSAVYERYGYLFNQYKHGLTVALRPFGGNPLPPDTIERRKTGLSGVPVGYEARSFAKSSKRKRESVVSFMLHPETQPYLNELMESDNLLRFSMENRETHIDTLIDAAKRLTTLVNVIVLNRADLVAPQRAGFGGNTFWLPLDDPGKPLGQIQVEVARESGRWSIDAFQEKL